MTAVLSGVKPSEGCKASSRSMWRGQKKGLRTFSAVNPGYREGAPAFVGRFPRDRKTLVKTIYEVLTKIQALPALGQVYNVDG